MQERGDSELAAWRRLEAQLGFDPDGAPDELMRSMGKLADQYEADGVAEAALATQGEQAAKLLEEEIAAARRYCDVADSAREGLRIIETYLGITDGYYNRI